MLNELIGRYLYIKKIVDFFPKSSYWINTLYHLTLNAPWIRMGLPKYGLPSLFLYLLHNYVSLEFFSYSFLPIDNIFSLTKATKQSWCSLSVAKRNQIKGLPFLLSSRMSCFTFQRKSKLYFSNTLSPFPENLSWAIPIIRQSPHLSANNWKMENRSYVFTNT